MLRVESLPERLKSLVVTSRHMHGSQHGDDEPVDSVRLGNHGNQRRDFALVGSGSLQRREDKSLEVVHSVLEGHQVHNGLVSLVGVVNGSQRNVILVLKHSVEGRVVLVEGELLHEEPDILGDELAITMVALVRTSVVVSSSQRLDEVDIGLGISQRRWVALLKHLVDGDQGLEDHDIVGLQGLNSNAVPEGLGRPVVMGVHNACSHVFPLGRRLVCVGRLLMLTLRSTSALLEDIVEGSLN